MTLCEVCLHSEHSVTGETFALAVNIKRAERVIRMVGAPDMHVCRRHFVAYGVLKQREKSGGLPQVFLRDPTNPQVMVPGRLQ